MPTTIEVNKQSVEALLGSGKSKPFVIPEYQRPYAWTDEQVETLFEDLWDFTATSGGRLQGQFRACGTVPKMGKPDRKGLHHQRLGHG